jgi:quercetin dioxygenase-like cupin family protein
VRDLAAIEGEDGSLAERRADVDAHEEVGHDAWRIAARLWERYHPPRQTETCEEEGAMRTLEASRELAHPHPRPEWFSGPVSIQELNDATEAPGLELIAVFFDAGARTLPHTHSTDQLLYFLEGEGVVGTQGDRRRYRAGGMAVIPANEWHWHGAVPASPTCHLSIRPGGPSVWTPGVPMHDWDAYMSGMDEGA